MPTTEAKFAYRGRTFVINVDQFEDDGDVTFSPTVSEVIVSDPLYTYWDIQAEDFDSIAECFAAAVAEIVESLDEDIAAAEEGV